MYSGCLVDGSHTGATELPLFEGDGGFSLLSGHY